ncbi:SHOCT domain-containing protein [Chondrinema litorale]|uniref:SHOCT domain-containing protein n=1 Tax=Chondrinema litorale TaxID=2994555 RepID=UPI002543AC69|nr:SHOCT domain-containing protein [Chondrinema litorale]UZR95776.1 SHOCT domain-containing protein [Chondrinema litorale]
MNSIFTESSLEKIAAIADKYKVSTEAVSELANAIIKSNGTMAQFNIPELGGSGQWMQGGMTMVGDMFNNSLKALVDGLCYELSGLYQNGNIQYKSIPKSEMQNSASFNAGNWWGDLGQPSSSGSQNNIHYAIFPYARRLAIQQNGKITVYDTLSHQISGVSQQQGRGNDLTFSSQFGIVYLSTLPIISGENQQEAEIKTYEASKMNVEEKVVSPDNNEEDIFGKIEKLAGLKDKGILTQEEFESKKSELLSRL